MAVQTTYSASISKAYPGLVADCNPKELVTGIVETDPIPFGRMVSQGTNDKQVVLGGTDHKGISVRALYQEGDPSTSAIQYEVEEPGTILRAGRIYVNLITTGSINDAIYSVDADGTIGAGTAGSGQTQITGGTLEETVGTADTVALIRIK